MHLERSLELDQTEVKLEAAILQYLFRKLNNPQITLTTSSF
jgi:hypothetical protein